MRGWWRDLTDLVLPAECGGCGRPRTVLCGECREALCGRAPRRVRPVPEPWGLPVVLAAAPYEDEARAVLLAHKERGALGLAGPLGEALAGAVLAGAVRAAPGAETWGWGDTGARSWVVGTHGGSQGRAVPLSLVPVPSARASVRARGHDPVRRIALAAAGELRRTGVPARVLAVLRQRRAVADQSGLGSRQRQANLAGALEVTAGGGRLLAGGGRIVVVDDLMTTGASLAEAARAIRDIHMESSERAETVRGPGTGAVRRPVWGRENAISAAVVAASPESFEINRN
ncbi:ComF family protein [Streptomyces sp. BG9H]|uniref:ComF family protein n=1 Tax=Streptomyces anatolicus TaxID=2675858 RepID=A0ABS6YPC0_9ACTN|nr:ComF family protein [Streptomyces anatolicus]MBW5423278.1 ComF family protein [Streptomyces anatolicus]